MVGWDGTTQTKTTIKNGKEHARADTDTYASTRMASSMFSSSMLANTMNMK